jgi:hypothetical protein
LMRAFSSGGTYGIGSRLLPPVFRVFEKPCQEET